MFQGSQGVVNSLYCGKKWPESEHRDFVLIADTPCRRPETLVGEVKFCDKEEEFRKSLLQFHR